MTEQEYVDATNLVRLRLALELLRDVGVVVLASRSEISALIAELEKKIKISGAPVQDAP